MELLFWIKEKILAVDAAYFSRNACAHENAYENEYA